MDAFRMKIDSDIEPKAVAGTTVYACAHYDYGLAIDDTRMTGVSHISVTLNEDGSYPLFTVPASSIEPLPKGAGRS